MNPWKPLPHTAQKGKRINTLENYYTELFYHQGKTIKEQNHKEINPLFELAYMMHAHNIYLHTHSLNTHQSLTDHSTVYNISFGNGYVPVTTIALS
jgi:hypothetical protein